tara:strand:- start:769 stop:1047 length:279 start_codon:yes stop_codon:yes gene_type:complete
MEIKKNRYGSDRAYQKVDSKRIRVTGTSKFSRQAQTDDGVISMYDFEGGPCFNLGGKIRFQHSDWKINKIEPIPALHEGLAEVVLHVDLNNK